MSDGSATDLLAMVKRYSRYQVQGTITVEELVNTVVDKLSGTPGDQTAIAAEVIAALSPAARAAMVLLIEEIERGDFRRHGFTIGPSPMSDVEEQRLSELRTGRWKVWASALARELQAETKDIRAQKV